ncbi:MAG: MarR family transcriptional regulator [Flavobacteriaceae bacterium]|nr:MarR family transcriptional regulator [Flavobacteriaceae bacterium]
MKQNIQFEKTILPFLGRAAKFAGFYFIDTFRENGIELSKEQWLVLKKLHDKDGQIQNDLAFITNRSKTSLTRLINTMVKKELVYRVNSKSDKRINHIHLSDLGKSVFEKSLPTLSKIINELQHEINEEDIQRTIKVLNHIENNICKKLKKQLN